MFIICSQRKSVACLLPGMIIYQLTKNHAIKINDDVTETRRSKSCFTPLKPRLRDTHLDTSLLQTVHLQPYKHSYYYYCTCLKWTPWPTNIVPLVSLLMGFNCTSQIKFNNYI